MKYEGLIENIDSLYQERERVSDDDFEMIDAYDFKIITLILKYAFENNFELPGFNLLKFIRHLDCNPDDEDYDDVVDYDWHEDFDNLHFSHIENGTLPKEIQSLFDYYKEKWYPEPQQDS